MPVLSIGMPELVIIGIICAVPCAVVALLIVVVLVLLKARKPGD